MCTIKIIGGIWDGRILQIKNQYILDKVIQSLISEKDGFERYEIIS